MKQYVKKSLIEKLLLIAENPEASIILKIAKEIFGDDFQGIVDKRILIHLRNLKEISVNDGDNEELFEIQRKDGKNMYLSPADGWVAVLDEEIALYKINFDWLIRQIMNALDIADHHSPKVILEDNIWVLGQHRIEKQNINLIVIRNIKKNIIFDSLIDYLNNFHNSRNPVLVLALDKRLPNYLKLNAEHELLRIDEAMKWDKDVFELNTILLIGKMRGSVSKPGFSNGYRTCSSNGKIYEFTLKQSEALEFMDKENKPLHQTEILAHTSSQQGKKLRELFKARGGKVHEAWGVIIKSDRNGTYWLEY